MLQGGQAADPGCVTGLSQERLEGADPMLAHCPLSEGFLLGALYLPGKQDGSLGISVVALAYE